VTQQIIWNLAVPLDARILVHDGPPPTLVQFTGGAPTDRDHQILGEFLASRPATTVRLYGPHLSTDLNWLRHYSSVARINIDVDGIDSFEPLRVLPPDLEELTLGPCGTRRLSLAPVEHFTSLRKLTIVRHSQEIDVVGQLRTLERLTLVSLKLPDLDAFRTLPALWSFALKLGGTTNLKALPEMGHLRYLEVWRVNGLSDLSIEAGRASSLSRLLWAPTPSPSRSRAYSRLGSDRCGAALGGATPARHAAASRG
jgi:hypothetical protein